MLKSFAKTACLRLPSAHLLAAAWLTTCILNYFTSKNQPLAEFAAGVNVLARGLLL
jgi:hypothetical protein